MLADTDARYYAWYMTEKTEQRIVVFEWWPNGEFVSSMTVGKLYLKSREDPGDVWEPGKLIGEMPWRVAQSLTREQGFNVEVAVKE